VNKIKKNLEKLKKENNSENSELSIEFEIEEECSFSSSPISKS